MEAVVPNRTFGKARILLVDDHPLVREGLTLSINQAGDMEVCGSVATASQALQALTTLRPDVAVLDLSLEGANGLDLLKDLRAQHPHVRVMVLSMHDELLYAERVARAGGRGYMMKKEPPEKLVEAIRNILRGGLAFSEALVWRLHQEITDGKRAPDASPVARLTDRELAVLEALGRGRKSCEIAADFHVSVKTIQAHCEHIKEKLELPNFISLLRFAVHWLDSAIEAKPNRPASPTDAQGNGSGEGGPSLPPSGRPAAATLPTGHHHSPRTALSKHDLTALANEMVEQLARRFGPNAAC